MLKVMLLAMVITSLIGCTTGSISPDFVHRTMAVSEENDLNREKSSVDSISAQKAIQETELDRALRRLVDDLELAVLGLPDSGSGDEAIGEHIVAEGEYLDLIIEKTMPNSPIEPSLLRKAFVQLNPNSFGGRGNPNYLFAKTKLKIPSVDDLKEIIFKSGELEDLKTRSRDPHRGWIQYP